MKNNIFYIIFFFITCNIALAESFNFQTKKIEVVKEDQLIKAAFGKATSRDGNLIINADKFIYRLKDKILEASGNGSIIVKDDNLEILFNDLIFNQNTSLISLNGDVQFIEKNKGLEIYTSSTILNQNENFLQSNTKTKIIDKFNNNYLVNKFYYEINNDLLKVEDLIFIDTKKNKLESSLAYLNINNGKLYSKDTELNLASSDENGNEPRIKGKSVINDDEFTEIKKGVFTNCKKRDGCPPWKISSEKIKHDKKNKIINYENAKFYIYDFPILYLPRFYYPDPTVKRQSGFLPPSLNNSLNNSKNFISIPYFYAPTDNKDFTITPRLYTEQNLLFQTEFRQVNKNSDHNADFSFFGDDNDGHIFYEYRKLSNSEKFQENEISVKLQQVSDDNYIKRNKIYSRLNDDLDFLENSINLSLNSDNFFFDLNSTVFENLNKDKNDKYEFIVPKIDFFWDIEDKDSANGDLTFESNNLARNYNTNVYEKSNINNFYFLSNPIINNLGIINNYEFIIKNVNTDSKNSPVFKEKNNFDVSGLLQLNSTFPLEKQSNLYQSIFTPKVSMKIAPNHTKNYRNDDNKINVNNIYSLNRINKNDTIEGGLSLTYGADYNLINKNQNEILSFRLANNLRINDNPDISHLNQLNQKTSNFFTETYFKPTNFLDLKYDATIKNNLSDIAYENIVADLKFKSFEISFDYLNENNSKEENSYLSNTASYNIDNSNSIIFGTRENKIDNFTEFYKLIYQYKNDCLTASIEYNKDYYNDKDLNSEESIFLKFSIQPFSQSNSSNLSK